MVDDAEVEAGLAALVLGAHPLQLVLPGGHLHEAGVGVDEDGVEVVHLDVSLEAYLLFAAEGAARRGGEGVHPLPAAFQLRPGGGVLTVEVSGLPVGQEAGRQGLFLSRESGAPGRQGVPLGFEGGQVGGFACLRLLGRQGRDCSLGSGVVLPGLGQSRRSGIHPGPEGAALVFQPGQRPAGFFPAGGGQSGPGLGTLGLQSLGGGRLPGGFLGGSPCLGLEGRALGGLFLPLVLLPGFSGEGGGILLLRLVEGFLCGVQGEGRKWTATFSQEALGVFDYLFTDAMTIIDHKGRNSRIYRPEEVHYDGVTKEQYMDHLVDQTVKILTNEPADIYANPTYLPDDMQADYDRYWTDARVDRVLDVLERYGIALEINARYRIPSFGIIRRAKQRGIKFTFGTNNVDADFGRLEYSLEAVEKCGLTADDIWFPAMSVRRGRPVVLYNKFE